MIKLIVGLGNPGAQYTKTRHNAGFWFLDLLNSAARAQWRSEKKFFGEYSKIFLDTHALHLLKPQTFMNRSGQSVAALAHFYGIEPQEILIAHDELDLPEGTAKLKFGGGHGGHNGLRDTMSALSSKDFYRLRLGIGHPGDRAEVVNYVLKAPGQEGRAAIDAALLSAERIMPVLLRDGVEKAMLLLHTRDS